MDDKLTALLRERLEFCSISNEAFAAADKALLYEKECTCAEPELGRCAYHDNTYDLRFGMKCENARLAPLHELLIECVAALEKYADKNAPWDNTCCGCSMERIYLGDKTFSEVAGDALTRLREGVSK